MGNQCRGPNGLAAERHWRLVIWVGGVGHDVRWCRLGTQPKGIGDSTSCCLIARVLMGCRLGTQPKGIGDIPPTRRFFMIGSRAAWAHRRKALETPSEWR